MTACVWDAPGVVEDFRVIGTAKADHEWRATVNKCRELVPALLRISEIIETSWYELSPEQQNQAVSVRATIEDIVKRAAEERSSNIFERLARGAQGFWWSLNQTDLMPYMYATVRFMLAVDRALANETRKRRAMEKAMSRDSEIIAQVERGEADFAAGRITRYSREEFARRFILT